MTFFGEYSSVLLKSLDKIMTFLADILVWFWGLPEDFVPFLYKLWRFLADILVWFCGFWTNYAIFCPIFWCDFDWFWEFRTNYDFFADILVHFVFSPPPPLPLRGTITMTKFRLPYGALLEQILKFLTDILTFFLRSLDKLWHFLPIF